VTGGTGADTLVLARATYTGTSDLKDGANVLDVTHVGATDISTANVSATGGTLALVFDGGGSAQNITMTSTEYNLFTPARITDGAGHTPANSTVTLTDARRSLARMP